MACSHLLQSKSIKPIDIFKSSSPGWEINNSDRVTVIKYTKQLYNEEPNIKYLR